MISGRSSNGKPLSILLVEDDDGDAFAIQRAFQKSQIANDMQRACDGVEAMEMLTGTNGREKVSSPYVLLVDINMPRMSGIEFVKALREDEALRRSVVFIFTTSNRREDKAAAYSYNVAGYIVKSTDGWDFQDLLKLLDCFWHIVDLP
jgi:CheY-like chemotaxis protein